MTSPTLTSDDLAALGELAAHRGHLNLRRDERYRAVRCHTPGDPHPTVAALPGPGYIGRRWLAAVHARRGDTLARVGRDALAVTAASGDEQTYTAAEYGRALFGALAARTALLTVEWHDAVTRNPRDVEALLQEAAYALLIATPWRKAEPTPRAPRPAPRYESTAERMKRSRASQRERKEALVRHWLTVDYLTRDDMPAEVTTADLYAEWMTSFAEWRAESTSRADREAWKEEGSPFFNALDDVPLETSRQVFHAVARDVLGEPRRAPGGAGALYTLRVDVDVDVVATGAADMDLTDHLAEAI